MSGTCWPTRRGEKPGFPRFRSFRRYDSITFPSYGDGCRWLEDGKLRIQGTGLVRSEEHTSELQSRRDLVCRLLLEKKKKQNKKIKKTINTVNNSLYKDKSINNANF